MVRKSSYGVVVSWLIENATFLQQFNISAQIPNPSGCYMSIDGTKLYSTASSGNKIAQNNLSTPWDVSSIVSGYNFTTSWGNNQSVTFRDSDGLKMIMLQYGAGKLIEYDLSTAWELSSATQIRTKNTNTGGTCMYISQDGLRLWIGNAYDDVKEYSFGTAWNISTITLVKTVDFLSKGVDYINFLSFKPDGTQLYLYSFQGTLAFSQFTLSTPWDISTAGSAISLKSYATKIADGYIRQDGKKIYLCYQAGSVVQEFDWI
tara:strand:- start:2829 stop:3611 length:783 start_codon:yes stop_codon:yes gene_type:complete